MLTLKQAKNLQYRDIIHDEICQKWRVNGKVKIWKRNPNKIRIPIKYGLYSYDYITESDLPFIHLEKDCPKLKNF